MKKIIFIIATLFVIISCKAQIIAVEDFENYNQELPDGAYIKDVNNVLDKYIGTWKGTYNNKNYEFIVQKVTKNNIDLKYKHDKLLMRYKITDSNGTELANTLNLPNENYYVINGSYLASSGGYKLSYIGLNSECGQNGTIYISTYGANNTKLQLFLMVRGEIHDCTTGAAEQIIPTESMELMKQ
ncbi:DUF6705 family protein [Tenacibaculum haliotis]|uniref:DUF6705 family protein n=1 Tax=Tenacibaculum haliotis TaxID=1888914 RepID=UPI0021AE988C|nr:DUF6705 family protein [Tenacibaculum haliotis]MCT4697565.1 hypothetical protein [Tenacibaculum haliotis]